MSGALEGLGVAVTRPAHQAGRLCRLIEAEGGRAIRFPALEIAPPRDPAAAQALVDRLDQYDLAVFVSPNAAERGLALVRGRRGALPPGLAVAAVGAGTARALRALGVEPALVPEGRFDSEALLALPGLAPERVAGRRVVIFRGEGGRELLARTLRARGARVDYAEVYRRERPRADPAPLLEAWRRGALHAVVVTSGEALRNLCAMVGEAGRDALLGTQVVGVSGRVVQLARELGFRRPPVVARAAADEAIVEALRGWWRGQRPAGR